MIQIIYASTSGNVEAVAERVAQELRSTGALVELHRAEQISLEVIASNSRFIFATSTWEHGVLNPFFQKLDAAMAAQSVEFAQGKQAAFIGLGDTRYEPVLFCEGVEQLRRTWAAVGGQEVGSTLKINGEPYHLLETTVKAWAARVAPLLSAGESSS